MEEQAKTLRELYNLGFASSAQTDRPATLLRSVVDFLKPDQESRMQNQLALIARLSEGKDPKVAPWLLPGIHAKDPRVRQACSDTVARLMKQVPSSKLPSLEYSLRPNYSEFYFNGKGYLHLSPEDFGSARNQEETEVLGLASFHPDGHIREAICKLLGPGGIRYLLLRLNDWVPQVRAAALRSLEPLIGEHHQEWVDNLGLLYRLEGCCRFSDQTFIGKVEEALRQPQGKNAVIQGFQHADKAVCRKIYPLALGFHVPAIELFQKALDHPDIVLRRWGVTAAELELKEDKLREFLEVALKNKSPVVRKNALQSWFKGQRKERTETLLDPSRAVRELAQYHHKHLDRIAFYRQHLEGHPQAILGLIEVGCKDIGLVLPLLEHQSLKVKKAALKAIAMLENDGKILLDFLESEHPGLSRLAANGLETVPGIRPKVERIYAASQTEHVLLNSSRLIIKLSSHWERLLFIAETAVHPSLALRDKAIQSLHAELGRGKPAYAPSKEAIVRLKALEPELKSVLTEEELRRLQQRLR